MLFPVWAYMLSRVNNCSDKNEEMEKGDKKKTRRIQPGEAKFIEIKEVKGSKRDKTPLPSTTTTHDNVILLLNSALILAC